MNLSRNQAFLRSIIFGAIAKVAGGLMVFFGLPLIGRILSVGDYAIFLYGMAVAGALTFFFGAAGTLCTRELAKAYSTAESKSLIDVENKSFGLYISVFAVSAICSAPVIWATTTTVDQHVMFLVMALALAQGLMRLGDVNRVASRTDHISSLWQFTGNVAVVALLFLWQRWDLVTVILVYFGVPLFVQAVVLTQIWIEKRRIPSPEFDFAAVLKDVRSMLPILLFQIGDYAKIYLSGIAVSMISDDLNYTRFATLVLISARLVNPVSLITRPLMPAFVDARHHRDEEWLNGAKKVIIYLLVGCYATAALVVFFIDPGTVQWLLPSDAPKITQIEFGLVLLFIGSQGFIALISPFFFAGDGTKFLAYVNFISVIISIAVGAIATVVWGAIGMLAAIGCGGTISLGICLAFAYRQLLTLSLSGKILHSTDPDSSTPTGNSVAGNAKHDLKRINT